MPINQDHSMPECVPYCQHVDLSCSGQHQSVPLALVAAIGVFILIGLQHIKRLTLYVPSQDTVYTLHMLTLHADSTCAPCT